MRGGRGMGGGGMRGGGLGRSGGMRTGGAGRSLGGGAGRAGRGAGGGGLSLGGLGGGARSGGAAPRRGPGFGTGMAVGMGLGMGMGGRRRRWGGGWGQRRMGPGAPMGRGGGCGCGTIVMAVVVLIIVLAIIGMITNLGAGMGGGTGAGGTQITTSTSVRTPLPRTAATGTGAMFTDNLGWIGNRTALERGLSSFQDATGVRPHVYITGAINGNTTPTPAQVQAFTRSLYDEMFTDEAHILLVFFESGEWPNNITEIYAQPGILARAEVMDNEALDILLDFIEYYNRRFFDVGDVTIEQVFANAFSRAGERIMYRPPDNRAIWITILVVGGVILLVMILINFWKKKQAQKNLEAEQTERILSQTLDTFGSQTDEASKLAELYNDNENK